MDPTSPSSFTHKTTTLFTGRTYHFVDQIPEGWTEASPTLLLIHGWPDLWYGWRFQIGPWVKKGYRVIVPDMLGYGGTDKPMDVAEYTIKKLCADLAALLDFLGIQKSIVIGHDWGSVVAQRFSLWHPDRLKALAILSYPWSPPLKEYVSLEEQVQRIPSFGYQLYLADPSSTAEIEKNLERFYNLVIRSKGPSITPLGQLRKLVLGEMELDTNVVPLLDAQELAYYMEQNKNMLGPLSYYRTTRLRYEEEKAGNLPASPASSLPVLYLGGAKDPTSIPAVLEISKALIPQLELVILEGVSHWIMVQAKEDVTQKVGKWLSTVTDNLSIATRL